MRSPITFDWGCCRVGMEMLVGREKGRDLGEIIELLGCMVEA